MSLAHLVSGRYGRPLDGEPYTSSKPRKGWLSRLLARVFTRH